MEKTISTNQASLILCIFTVALKLSALPAIMFFYSGNDSYIACLIALIFDFVGTIIIVHFMHKNPDCTFPQLLTQVFGKVFSIIIQIILYAYFFIKAILVLQELHDYFIATLFEELNPIFFIVVLGLIIFYSTTKNFRTIGRLIQLIFWPLVVAIVFSLLFPIGDLQIEKLFPIFEEGFYPIFQGLSRTTFAFGDFIILLPMMGYITYNKKSKKQIILYATATFMFIFNFFVIFVGSFGDFATSQTLALSELPLHNTTPATIGKLEWLTITIWTVILLIDAIILSIACRTTFDNIFNTFGKKSGAIVISTSITIVLAMTYLQLEGVVEFAVSTVFASIAGIIQVLMIILLALASIIKSCKNKHNNSSSDNLNKKEKLKC
ncbi:MAG: GerAB/ArcD/ProY family transporter [Christensenellales bacterium]